MSINMDRDPLREALDFEALLSDYSIYKKNATYHGISNFAGGMDYSDASFPTVFNLVKAALPNGGTILLKGGAFTGNIIIDQVGLKVIGNRPGGYRDYEETRIVGNVNVREEHCTLEDIKIFGTLTLEALPDLSSKASYCKFLRVNGHGNPPLKILGVLNATAPELPFQDSFIDCTLFSTGTNPIIDFVNNAGTVPNATIGHIYFYNTMLYTLTADYLIHLRGAFSDIVFTNCFPYPRVSTGCSVVRVDNNTSGYLLVVSLDFVSCFWELAYPTNLILFDIPNLGAARRVTIDVRGGSLYGIGGSPIIIHDERLNAGTAKRSRLLFDGVKTMDVSPPLSFNTLRFNQSQTPPLFPVKFMNCVFQDGMTITQIGASGGPEAEFLSNQGIPDTLISPAEKYLPLYYRTDQQGLIYFVDPYIVIRVHTEANHWISWLGVGKTFGYGTYEWKAKAENAVANTSIYIGGLEYHHGWSNEGIACIRWDGTKWEAHSSWGGSGESTEITGITFTNENTFKIEWTDSYVKYYVNDVLKATHTTYVPQAPMQLFAEVGTAGSAPASEPKCFFRKNSWKRLS